MKRKDLIKDIVEDIKNNLHPGNAYLTQPVDVYRGYHQWDEIKQTPALSLTITKDERVDDELGTGLTLRNLYITVYGYAKTDGYGDATEIHDLLNDFETFILSIHNRYADRVLSINNIEVYEGGVSDPALIFQLEFVVNYLND